MSRQIANDHRWSDEEAEYKISRGQQHQVQLNREQFPAADGEPELSVDDSPKLKLDPDIFDYVKGLEVEKLKSEIQKRQLIPKGDEKEMKIQLAQVLQSERDSSGGTDA